MFIENYHFVNKKLDSDFLNKIKNRKIWCAASTHPTEEMLCAMSHAKIKESYNKPIAIQIRLDYYIDEDGEQIPQTQLHNYQIQEQEEGFKF